MLNTETLALDAVTLAACLTGDVVAPGDKEYDLARRAWNLAVDQRPALVAFPADAADVREIVEFARVRGLRVAPQGTGHNASPLPRLDDVILLSTQRMRGVEIDVERRIARVAAGTLWIEVTEARPRTASRRCPVPRPTWAWSATRSAAGSAGSGASTAWRPTA